MIRALIATLTRRHKVIGERRALQRLRDSEAMERAIYERHPELRDIRDILTEGNKVAAEINAMLATGMVRNINSTTGA